MALVQARRVARDAGREDELLELLLSSFDHLSSGAPRFSTEFFGTMFEWRMLTETYAPAVAAMRHARDAQQRLLLDGDTAFGLTNESAERFILPAPSRFSVIVRFNDMLDDHQATADLFARMLHRQAGIDPFDAQLALPSLVAAGEFAMAGRWLADTTRRLAEINKLAQELPLVAPQGAAPRLAAELMGYVSDVSLTLAVWNGLGRTAEAQALRIAAFDGLLGDELRALAERELASPGAISQQIDAWRQEPAGEGDTAAA